MTEKATEAKKKYQREWRRRNKDKVQKYNEQYWEKKAKEANPENGKSGIHS